MCFIPFALFAVPDAAASGLVGRTSATRTVKPNKNNASPLQSVHRVSSPIRIIHNYQCKYCHIRCARSHLCTYLAFLLISNYRRRERRVDDNSSTKRNAIVRFVSRGDKPRIKYCQIGSPNVQLNNPARYARLIPIILPPNAYSFQLDHYISIDQRLFSIVCRLVCFASLIFPSLGLLEQT